MPKKSSAARYMLTEALNAFHAFDFPTGTAVAALRTHFTLRGRSTVIRMKPNASLVRISDSLAFKVIRIEMGDLVDLLVTYCFAFFAEGFAVFFRTTRERRPKWTRPRRSSLLRLVAIEKMVEIPVL